MSVLTPLSEFDDQLIDGLQFCAKTYRLFEQIRNSEDGRSRLRMRPTVVEKKLIEELLPICKYVQAKYKAGRYIAIRWLNGNQQFDAEIVQTGAYVEQGFYPASAYLEATCVMHKNDYLNRERLDSDESTFGHDGLRRLKTGEIESIPICRSNHEFIKSYSKIIFNQIQKKVGIKYPPETTLIIQCSLDTNYMPDDWEILMTEVRIFLPSHQFREIFIYDVMTEYTCSLYGIGNANMEA